MNPRLYKIISLKNKSNIKEKDVNWLTSEIQNRDRTIMFLKEKDMYVKDVKIQYTLIGFAAGIIITMLIFWLI